MSRGRQKGQVVPPSNMTAPHGMPISMWIAVNLAQEFRAGAAPTITFLMRRFEMSRATAYRWRRAWVEAESIAAARAGVPT